MDPDIQRARAIVRGKEERIRINKDRHRPGLYWAWSHTDPGKRYILVVREEDEICSCKGFYYRGICKHVEQLRNRLARTGERNIFHE